MMNKNVGELVYIPSETSLMKYNDGHPQKIVKLEKPTYLLIREVEEDRLGVDFEGDVWYVERRKVYNA